MKSLNYLLIILIFTGCSSFSDDRAELLSWRLFRGNSSLQGYADVNIPETPQLLWTAEHKQRSVASPVILNGTVFCCDRRGYIRGINPAGETIFIHDFATAVEAPLMLHDSVLYVARIDGIISALSLRTKNILWEYETEGQLSGSANILSEGDKQYILFGSYDYYLYCLNVSDGKLVSRFASNYYINGAIALSGHYALFGGCDALVRKVDVLKGVMSDSLELAAYIPASPAIDDNKAYIGDYNGTVYKIDLNTMKLDTLFRSTNGDNSFLSTPAVNNGQIVFCGSDQHLHSISDQGKELWTFLTGNTGESSPVLTRNHVLVCNRSGVIYLLNRKTGFLQWTYDTGEQIVASPAVISDRFYILTAKGTLFCFGNDNIKK